MSGSSLVQRCDREVSIMTTPWPTRGCCAMEKKNVFVKLLLEKEKISEHNVLIMSTAFRYDDGKKEIEQYGPEHNVE